LNFSFDYFDQGIDRIGTRSEKWDALFAREKNDGLLPMWVADMDFQSPPAVQKAMMERAAHGTYGYTEIMDDDHQAVTGFWQRRHGLSLSPEEVVMLPCVVTGLKACVQAFTEPGDGIIVQPPVYGPFYSSIVSNGRRVIENPLVSDEDGRYRMNLPQLEELLRAGAKMMLLCSPHNPVSRVWTKEELQSLFALLHKYRTPLVCDEIHADFALPPHKFIPALSLTGDNLSAKVVTLAAASKTFNLAGLQQATLFTRHGQMREKIEKVLSADGVKSGNIFALEGTRAAYEKGDAWLDGLIKYLAAGSKLLAEELKEKLPRVKLPPIEGTYLAWLDLRDYGLSCDALTERATKAGLALTEGTFFGKEAGEGFMRLNFGCPHKNITEAVVRLKRALEGE
jgi:cystathionine beta-lyase